MKRITLSLSILCALFSLAGCGDKNSLSGASVEPNPDSITHVALTAFYKNHLRYIHDERTGYSFAIYDDGNMGRGPTMVLLPSNISDSLAVVIK